MVSYSDVKDEHEAALARLDFDQRCALYRIERAEQMCAFNGRSWLENLTSVIEAEAERRNCSGTA